MIINYKNKQPRISENVFIAGGAVVIGDVHIMEGSSIWFHAVVRGDVNYIRIGTNTNVQDGSILHVTHNKYSLEIGSFVTIGHRAVVHGCRVKDNVLIGMGAIILDDAEVNSNSLIAAGSVIKEHFIVPEGVMAAGVPAKIIRDLTSEEILNINLSAVNYSGYAKNYLNDKLVP
ncbi:MAG: gamma carbonic anhydrase family protein [bacterium]|nr:gamma carbonic anhydrase family protein [bacterium]